MKIIGIYILIFLSATLASTIEAQTNRLAEICSVLSKSMYEDSFDFNSIQANLELYRNQLDNSSLTEYENCNCADSLWVLRHTHMYQYIKKTHSPELDTIQFLNNMSHEIDMMNLRSELRFFKPKTLIDSFEYVIERLKIKNSKKKYIYNLINAEIDFLKKNKYSITDFYFEVIDNEKSNQEIIDDILVSLFNSNNQISDRIKNRIGKKQYEKHFYRMYGIINTSSSNGFPINQIEILSSINYKIEEEKVEFVLNSFYEQNSNNIRKLKIKHKKRIKKILKNEIFREMESTIKFRRELEKSR